MSYGYKQFSAIYAQVFMNKIEPFGIIYPSNYDDIFKSRESRMQYFLRINRHTFSSAVEACGSANGAAGLKRFTYSYLIITPALAQVFKDMSQNLDNMCDNYVETGKFEY